MLYVVVPPSQEIRAIAMFCDFFFTYKQYFTQGT